MLRIFDSGVVNFFLKFVYDYCQLSIIIEIHKQQRFLDIWNCYNILASHLSVLYYKMLC
jgi:hypothetical protein